MRRMRKNYMPGLQPAINQAIKDRHRTSLLINKIRQFTCIALSAKPIHAEFTCLPQAPARMLQ